MKTDEIKRLSIKEVLDRLWVEYFHKSGAEYGIVDQWQKSSGWAFNTEKNIIYDFSHGDRPQGDTFWFVKQYNNYTDEETFKRFSDKFWISTPIQKSIMSIWRDLKDVNQQQIEYLHGRQIDPTKIHEIIKNYNGGIGCLVYENDTPKWLNARTLLSDKTRRFLALSWYPTKGVYQHKVDKEKKYIIVVEWLIDFLTLRQYDTNVIGLKSAESGVEEVIRMAKKHEILFVWDNDDAGKKTREKLKWVKYKFFDVSEYGAYKDINDMECDLKAGAALIDFILEKSTVNSPINSTFEKLKTITTRLRTYGKLGYGWPLPQLYDDVSWVIPWLVYTIGAYSNTGKSKFAYYHIGYFLSIGKRVCLVSLEVDEAMALLEIICAREGVTRREIIGWYEATYEYYSNLCIKNDLYKLNDIVDFISLGDYDIYFIDFVQNIQEKWSAYEMHASIAKGIQRAAINSNSTVFALSQISNNAAKDMKNGLSSIPSLKWAWEYYASSDIVFMLQKTETQNVLKLTITKNKYEKEFSTYLLNVDFSRNKFEIDRRISDWF